MQEIQLWLGKNAMWVFPLCLAIGGAIAWLFKQRQFNQHLKLGDQDINKGIIERLRTERDDLKEIIKEKTETISHQRAIISKQGDEKNEMLQRIYKYQDNEVEFTKKIGDLERHVAELKSQVEILSSMFPDLIKKKP